MSNITILSDKMAVLQVLGCLAKNPSLFENKDYKFHVDDFSEQFHRIVFGAIEHLAANGAEKIAAIDIDQYLAPYSVQYKVFSDNKGIEYVMQAMAMVEEENLRYYYQILKKFSLLNQMQQLGLDITPIYDTTLTDPKKITKMQDRFNEMGLDEILGYYDSVILNLKQKFGKAEGIEEAEGGDGLLDLIDSLEQVPEMGLPLISPKMTTMFRGRRLKKFYMESGAQGTGKSRRAAGEACNIAVPYFYNTKRKEWIFTGLQEPTLLITTELEIEEVQTLFLAYVSGVPEEHILNGSYGPGEKMRVVQAARYIKDSSLYVVQITNFDMDDIENIIRKYHNLHQVGYVFYDYLSTSMKVLSEGASKTRISNLREDQILLMFSDRLKCLCNSLNIHIQTATQLSGNWKEAKDVDQSLLRGAKSLSDKTDVSLILLPIRESDKPIIEAYASKGFELMPNLCMHIFKLRRGKYKDTRVYVYFDYSTCRMEDCFVTDKEGNMIKIEDTEIEILQEDIQVDAETGEVKEEVEEDDIPFDLEDNQEVAPGKKFNISF